MVQNKKNIEIRETFFFRTIPQVFHAPDVENGKRDIFCSELNYEKLITHVELLHHPSCFYIVSR